MQYTEHLKHCLVNFDFSNSIYVSYLLIKCLSLSLLHSASLLFNYMLQLLIRNFLLSLNQVLPASKMAYPVETFY